MGVNRVDYKVRSRKDLAIVIEHFKQYPLHTSKMVNFVYFCKIFELIGSNYNTKPAGFLHLASLINKLNKPLSLSLLDQLSKIGIIPNVELESPIIDHNPKLDPFWISGFISGEGSFTYFTRTRLNSKNDSRKDYTLVF